MIVVSYSACIQYLHLQQISLIFLNIAHGDALHLQSIFICCNSSSSASSTDAIFNNTNTMSVEKYFPCTITQGRKFFQSKTPSRLNDNSHNN